jgi:tetratricopeptide (TPR) repeat protein
LTAKTLSDVAYEARLREHLKILWWSRGTPQKQLARALGVNPSQITLRFKGEVAFRPHEVAALLDAMGVDHGEFYDGVAGRFHAEVYVARIAMGRKRQKNYAISDLMAGGPSRPYTADELRTMAEGLQDLRIVDPEAARVHALDILASAFHHGIDPGVEGRFEALLALAAVYRSRGSDGTAAAYLLKALHKTNFRGWMKARAQVSVVAFAVEQGDFLEAVAAADLAVAKYAVASDRRGHGRALVSKGSALGPQGRIVGARSAFREALFLLPEEDWSLRVGAFQGLALCYLLGDEIEKAHMQARNAVEALESGNAPHSFKAETLWLRGEIALRSNNSVQGTADLRRVLEIYLDDSSNVLYAVLVSLRLASTFLASGNLDELRELCVQVTPSLVGAAKSDRLLRDSLNEFAAVALRGELSSQLLATTYQQVLAAAGPVPRAAYLTER